MKTDDAKRIISTIPPDHHFALAAAYNRYMHVTGVWCGDGFSDDQIAEDRLAYQHLLKYSDKGVPALSNERCAEFMAAVSGLPIEWCLAWDEVEFYNEHGDFDELVAAKRAS